MPIRLNYLRLSKNPENIYLWMRFSGKSSGRNVSERCDDPQSECNKKGKSTD